MISVFICLQTAHSSTSSQGTTPATNTSTRANDVIAYYESVPITESSNSTDILAGARTTSPVTIEHNQRPILLFVFNVRIPPLTVQFAQGAY